MKRSASLACLIALVSLPACFGTETGNPPFAPEVGYGGFEPMGLAPDPTVDSARVAMDEVAAVDCEGARFPMLRRVAIDFTSGLASVGESLEIPSGTYCGLEIAVAACSDPDLCRVVAPESVNIDATRRTDAASVVVRDAERLEVSLEGEPFELGPDEGGVLIALDLNALVAGLSIGTAPTDPEGVVRIDATNDPTRLDAVRAGLRGGLSLRRDLDDDGILDREELLDPPLATAP